MVDESREVLRRQVYSKLLDADFRAALTAATADGDRPVLVALREDAMSAVVDQATTVGGAANVTVPLWGGIVILSMTSYVPGDARPGSGAESTELISDDCTVGLFLQRALIDAPEGQPISYSFRAPQAGGPARTGEARAQLAGSSL